MKLMLSLRMPAPPEGVEGQHVLEEGSMTIGRGPDATWTIPDSARVISKHHCRIDATPDGFTIKDISTNGAFLNGQPIANQPARMLADGDLLKLGDFVIAVGIESADRPAAESLLPPDGPFGENDAKPDSNSEAATPTLADHVPAAGGPLRDAAGPIAEDWWKEVPPASPESIVGSPGPGAPAPVADAIVISLIESFPEIDAATLAQGVDVAGAVVSDQDWQTFYNRLRSYLRERYPENA